jgi:Transcription factor AFT
MPSIASLGPFGPPPLLGSFNTRDECTDILQADAFDNMYTIIESTYVPLKKAVWTCSRSRVYRATSKNPEVHPSKKWANTSTTNCRCPFRICATYKVGTNWTITFVNLEHNHEVASANSALPQHRLAALGDIEREKVSEMNKLEITPTQILQALQLANPTLVLVVHDIYNLLYCLQLDELSGKTPVEWLL